MGRFFGDRQRLALFMATGGRCANCGKPLSPGWHGDHMQPWSQGGATDVINGQALCPDCNQRKGARGMGSLSPWKLDLREWQLRAFNTYVKQDQQDFLAVATPGAGKTRLALRIIHHLLSRGIIERIVVVCPTSHLRMQWEDKAKDAGIMLDGKWQNDEFPEARDYHGMCVTYQQVASLPDLHRLHCRRRTLVIFDEIHHAGDSNTWGESIKTAFEPATRRLAISGTPFRTDNNPIPFVVYEDNLSKADFTYGYAKALSDKVCRPVLFPSYEGHMEWFYQGDYIDATFRDELNGDQANQRLKTALYPKSDWISQVVRDAHEKLMMIRSNGHPDAGGLMIASDKMFYAPEYARVIESITGIAPEIATSDDPEASSKIERFAASNNPWLVAVKMVSEGIDIPRLRVGIYATNIVTELYFRQAVGRFVRWIEDIEDQSAYVYIPRDERLIGFAQKIKEERDHQLTEEREQMAQARAESTEPKQYGLYAAISATGQADDVFYDHEVYSQADIARAKAIINQIGFSASTDPTLLLKALKLWGTDPTTPEPTGPAKEPAISLRKQKDARRRMIKRLARQLVEASNDRLDYQLIFSYLKRHDGVEQKDATLEQLDTRIQILIDWLKDPIQRR